MTQAATELDLFTALTESLEQSPPCDVGRIGKAPEGIPPCENPADFSCRVHMCGTPDGVVVFLCAHHFDGIVRRVRQYLDRFGGAYAENCGHVVRSVDDFIWGTTPLR